MRSTEPSSREKTNAPLDPFGALLSIVGLSALVCGIIEGPDNGWMSTQTLASFAVAPAILAGFVAWELRVKEPMVDLGFFRNPGFTATTTAISLAFFAMFGSYFIIVQYMQFVRGYSPLDTGVRILPWALAYILSAMQSAKLVERFGQRRVVSSGLFIAGAGLAWMSTSGAGSSYWLFAGSLMTMAAGMGITTAPSTGAIWSACGLPHPPRTAACNPRIRNRTASRRHRFVDRSVGHVGCGSGGYDRGKR